MQGHSELTLQSKQHFSHTSDPRTAAEKGIDDTVQNGDTLKRLQSLDANVECGEKSRFSPGAYRVIASLFVGLTVEIQFLYLEGKSSDVSLTLEINLNCIRRF